MVEYAPTSFYRWNFPFSRAFFDWRQAPYRRPIACYGNTSACLPFSNEMKNGSVRPAFLFHSNKLFTFFLSAYFSILPFLSS